MGRGITHFVVVLFLSSFTWAQTNVDDPAIKLYKKEPHCIWAPKAKAVSFSMIENRDETIFVGPFLFKLPFDFSKDFFEIDLEAAVTEGFENKKIAFGFDENSELLIFIIKDKKSRSVEVLDCSNQTPSRERCLDVIAYLDKTLIDFFKYPFAKVIETGPISKNARYNTLMCTRKILRKIKKNL